MTDRSPPVSSTLPALLTNDDRISCVRQDCSGPGTARQRGIDLATGDLLCFLDDDDYYLPDHLQTLADTYTGDEQILATGMLTERPDGSRKKEALFPVHADPLCYYWNHAQSLHPFAVPKRIATAYAFDANPSPIEDFDWLCRILADHALSQIPAYTVVYCQHAANRTLTLSQRPWLLARMATIKRLYAVPAIADRIPRGDYLRMLTHQAWHWSRQCLAAGQRKEAWYGFRLGLKTFTPGSFRELWYTLYRAFR